MTKELENLVQKFEDRRITRRELVGTLVALMAAPQVVSGAESAAQAAPVARAQTLNHVSIGVSDVEASAAFYRRILGLEVVSRPGNGGINMGLRDGFLGLYSIPGFVGQPHHFCLGVPDYDPNAIAERLSAVGIEARIDTNPNSRTSGGDQLYFTDPDGTTVQLGANGYMG
ncbi:MAG: VOC family protein [Gemmatimonadota bacterium]|nr:VOC family protein [Gemmatimonadota bacterium]MDH3424578.1 VOC family protein [Gemmatimonadota bacterium]